MSTNALSYVAAGAATGFVSFIWITLTYGFNYIAFAIWLLLIVTLLITVPKLDGISRRKSLLTGLFVGGMLGNVYAVSNAIGGIWSEWQVLLVVAVDLLILLSWFWLRVRYSD